MLPLSVVSLFDVAFMTCFQDVQEFFEHGALYGKRGFISCENREGVRRGWFRTRRG